LVRHEGLIEALEALRAEVAGQPFAVTDPEQDARRTRRDRLVADLAAQVARLRDWDAPILAVLAGGTGAGKSSIANSLVGFPVAMTGVIRPTTSSPTLLTSPGDRDWFITDRVLPGLARLENTERGPAGQAEEPVLHLVATHAIPPGLAVLDAPDIDSVRTTHRDLADLLLDAADVWVWHVTPRTYADEEGMAYLRRAARRRTALAVVLTQVHDRDAEELVADLRLKLSAEGLIGTQVLTVPYTIADAHRLPGHAINDVRAWLHGLAGREARERLRRQTLEGALDDLGHETEPLVSAILEEEAVTGRLAGIAKDSFEAVPQRFGDALDAGLPMRQEVLARWRDFVGDGRLLKMIETAGGQVRGWLRGAMATVTGAEQQRLTRQVQAEVGSTVTRLIVEAHEVAASQVAAAWDRQPAGHALVEAEPHLRRPSGGLQEAAGRIVDEWQDAVAELIRTRGAERKMRARWLTTLVNAGATAAILLTFASTGGLTGAETGIALGAGAANQALLAKLLGAHNLQWLQQRVREDLVQRVGKLAAAERGRYSDALAPITPTPGDARRLLDAVAAVDRARR
jgi:hypothetical protein